MVRGARDNSPERALAGQDERYMQRHGRPICMAFVVHVPPNNYLSLPILRNPHFAPCALCVIPAIRIPIDVL